MVTYHYALLKVVTNDQELPMNGSLSGMTGNIQHSHPHADRSMPIEICRPRQPQGFSRVNVAFKFGSQVLPPSSENAC
jgi:hypothetical protein